MGMRTSPLKSTLAQAALAASLCCAASPATAEVRLAHVFGDHMVVQRNTPVRVWGWADAGEAVKVALAGRRASAVAAPNGRWEVSLPALPAGGPHELVVQGASATGAPSSLRLSDILVGDVWLCSGQSNMEWTLGQTDDRASVAKAGDYPLIRHVKVPHLPELQSQSDLPAVQWQTASPQTVGNFSAVGYYFARRMQQGLGQPQVPIGLVNASWGGTHLETWNSPRLARSDALLQPLMAQWPADVAAAMQSRKQAMADVVSAWQRGLPMAEAAEVASAAWASPDHNDSDWPTLDTRKQWESQGLPGVDGQVWMRREITLSAAEAASANAANAANVANVANAAITTLQLGTIDDEDETYINGQRVGATKGWNVLRRYAVPAGLLREGRNVIAVRVTDVGGGGGFYGEPALLRLELPSGHLPLAGAWRARVEAAKVASKLEANDLPTLAYNGMVAPIIRMRMAGVIWYQGESNVDRAAVYADGFKRMINDWRDQADRADQGPLPFYFVQLASFLPLEKNDLRKSAWSELRDAQRQALALPLTGMAVATDVGDAHDIHPRNKQPVGERLARHALRHMTGQGLPASGPLFKSMRVQGSQITLQFANTNGALAVRGAAPHAHGVPLPVQGFAVADDSQRFHPAQARLQGQRVVLHSPAVPHPTAVRYGWVDNPEQSNLTSADGLPTSPFRTDAWPLVTQGGRFRP